MNLYLIIRFAFSKNFIIFFVHCPAAPYTGQYNKKHFDFTSLLSHPHYHSVFAGDGCAEQANFFAAVHVYSGIF